MTPARFCRGTGASTAGADTVVASCGSWPLITCRTLAASATVRPNTEMQSSEEPNAPNPNRLTLPYPGLTPTMPQKLAGCRTEPPVSEPSAAGTTPAATSAADPPDDPPGTSGVIERVQHPAVGRVFRRRPHGKLIEIRLDADEGAQRHEAG